MARAANRVFLVAANDAGEPINYADLALDGHIDHLYCRPDDVGTCRRADLRGFESAARPGDAGFLFMEAGEAACRLSERRGYQVAHLRNLEIVGVSIHNDRVTERPN